MALSARQIEQFRIRPYQNCLIRILDSACALPHRDMENFTNRGEMISNGLHGGRIERGFVDLALSVAWAERKRRVADRCSSIFCLTRLTHYELKPPIG
jgi:hypothetical protein